MRTHIHAHHASMHERTHPRRHREMRLPESSTEDGCREEAGNARVLQVFNDVFRKKLKKQNTSGYRMLPVEDVNFVGLRLLQN